MVVVLYACAVVPAETLVAAVEAFVLTRLHVNLSRVMFVRVSSTSLAQGSVLLLFFETAQLGKDAPICLHFALQVMFVRVSTTLLAQRVPMAVKALKYSQWTADVAAAAAGLQHNLTARVLGESPFDLHCAFCAC
jgi:hypothetical protein